jgi:outer membrane protein assembly factor BamB
VFEIDGVKQLISPSAQSAVAYEPKTGKELWRVDCGGMNVPSRPIYGHGLLYLTTADGGLKFFALKPVGRGDLTDQIEWKQSKGAPRYTSPILVDDLIYSCNDQGIIAAIEAKTGDVVWQERIKEGVFTASPVYAAGKLYFCSEDGQTVVLTPGRKFDQVAINKLADGFMASPAVIEGALILRTKSALYRIQE